MQSDDSIMCVCYCIAFIECTLAGKTLFNYTKLFSCSDYKKNGKMIYKYFKGKYDKRECKPWLQAKKIVETRNIFWKK